MDGRQVKSVITLEANKMVHEQKGDKPQTIVREFSESELVLTCEMGDIKCKRVFKAI
jgi:fatty acid-binding protein 3